MNRKMVAKVVLGAGGLTAAAAAVLVYRRYVRETEQLRRRLRKGSEVIDTTRGAVEVAVTGDGPPVLFSGGFGGGYDQALGMARNWVGEGYTCIAPSRFGYLQSPPEGDSSPFAQADDYAALLDRLRIERVAVVATSAGAPAALQFALRHPDRASSLVLLAPASWAPPDIGVQRSLPLPQWAYDVLFASDFVFWLAATYTPDVVAAAIGASPRLMRTLADEDKAMAREAVRSMLPIGERRAGMAIDRETVETLHRYRLEDVKVPTLVVHACDDQLAPVQGGEYTCASIRQAEGIFYDTGGHMLLGRRDDIRAAVNAFLRKHPGSRTHRSRRAAEQKADAAAGLTTT